LADSPVTCIAELTPCAWTVGSQPPEFNDGVDAAVGKTDTLDLEFQNIHNVIIFDKKSVFTVLVKC